MRSPANIGSTELGNSAFQKVRAALNAWAKFTRSGSTLRTALSRLTVTGKDTCGGQALIRKIWG